MVFVCMRLYEPKMRKDIFKHQGWSIHPTVAFRPCSPDLDRKIVIARVRTGDLCLNQCCLTILYLHQAAPVLQGHELAKMQCEAAMPRHGFLAFRCRKGCSNGITQIRAQTPPEYLVW